MENKTCRQCNVNFTVEDEDLEFYQKMSPEFAGKKYQISSPTLCFECRVMRRLSRRNERKLYKRKCDLTGKDMVSIYSPDKEYKVYDREAWNGDGWDAMDYGRDYDFDRPFFEQFDELLKDVPRISLFNTATEDCEYANFIHACRNCYMSAVIFYEVDGAHYSYWSYRIRNSMDLSFCDDVENCYSCVSSTKCYGCRWGLRLQNCRDCYLSVNLSNCSDCILCRNLSNKQYCINNEQLTKDEYEQKKKELNLGSHQNLIRNLSVFAKLFDGLIVKYANLVNCEGCVGDDLTNSKNAKYCFSGERVEDCKYSFGQEAAKNTMDAMGGSYEWCYEVNHTGWGSYLMGTSFVIESSNMYYCESCLSCRDCFGCVGLKNKQYCIFNKQYTKEEYEELAGKLADHMIKNGEWGEYLPIWSSPFGYNETLAQSYFPLTKEQAQEKKAKWQDNDYAMKYDGPFYEPHDDIAVYQNSQEEVDKLLAGILKCEVSGKAYKIMPQEMAFYLAQGIPIPRQHYDVRYDKRFNMRNPRKLHKRQCMCEGITNDELRITNGGNKSNCSHEGRCSVEFETTYAPDRKERVYCEECYQKSVL